MKTPNKHFSSNLNVEALAEPALKIPHRDFAFVIVPLTRSDLPSDQPSAQTNSQATPSRKPARRIRVGRDGVFPW
jgi:hypothetical protein